MCVRTKHSTTLCLGHKVITSKICRLRAAIQHEKRLAMKISLTFLQRRSQFKLKSNSFYKAAELALQQLLFITIPRSCAYLDGVKVHTL